MIMLLYLLYQPFLQVSCFIRLARTGLQGNFIFYRQQTYKHTCLVIYLLFYTMYTIYHYQNKGFGGIGRESFITFTTRIREKYNIYNCAFINYVDKPHTEFGNTVFVIKKV